MGWSEDDENSRGSFREKDSDRGRDKRKDPSMNEAFSAFKDKVNAASSGGGSPTVSLKFWLFMILGLWALSGIFIIAPAEQSAITRLGRYVDTIGPGVHWVARGIESEHRINV